MAISGSCLCGGVQFVVDEVSGPVEICHCVRCQKKSGNTSLAMVAVKSSSYRCVSGGDLIQAFSAPVLNQPPAYSSHFCCVCGSAVPPASTEEPILEIPAGLFDDDPGVRPSKRIYIDFKHDWDEIPQDLPHYNFRSLYQERLGRELPLDHKVLGHDGKARTV